MLSEEYSTAQQFLQILITLLGVLSQVILLFQGFRTNSEDQSQVIPGDLELREKKESRRRIVDLSFVLLCSAFFSLLLTDSLLISGRTPTAEMSTILMVLAITAVVVGTMFTAWFLGRAELVTGFLAITTLLVLIVSPGGPFFGSPSDGESGLSLLIPVATLVIISSSMLVYSFGSPISKTVSRPRRLLVSSVLAILALSGAVALGRKLVGDVRADIRTPKIDSPAVRELLPALMGADLNDKRLFYQLASEVNLLRSYQNHFRAVRGEQAQPPGATAESITPHIPLPENAKVADQGLAAPDNQPVSPASVENKRRLIKEIIDDARKTKDRRSELYYSEELAKLSADSASGVGIARSDLRFNDFKKLDLAARQQYLSDRLSWIYPVGLPSQSQAGIRLPGITSEERLQAISSLRIIQILDDQENLRLKLFKEFDKSLDYPREVRSAFKDQDEQTTPPSDESSGSSKPKALYKPLLFAKLEPTRTNAILTEQLGLPFQAEAYVAYKEYRELALSLVKQSFKGRIGDADAETITEDFNKLNDETQEAFLTYVVYNKDPQSVYQMLLDLRQTGADFGGLVDSRDPLVIENLLSLLQNKSGSPNQESELGKLANSINGIQSAQSKDVFVKLLLNEESKVPIKFLFDVRVFNLVDQINRNLAEQRKEFFDAVADPIWRVVKDRASTEPPRAASRFQMVDVLARFRNLSSDDQNGLLHHTAVSLYQPGGEYSLDPIRLLVARSLGYGKAASILTSSMMTLPVLLISVFMGGLLARKLVARDRMRELLRREALEYAEGQEGFGTPVELLGRNAVLSGLRNLTERGWSTIGVVGRRGVGKSRILHALLEPESKTRHQAAVRVWVASPSKFHEEEFISSMLERLALSTESSIAEFLRVKPISIRRIENRSAQVGMSLYVCAVAILSALLYSMASRLARPDIVITWIPMLALILTSAGLFINHISRLQPVDLSSWLQRDRTHNPHTVMLYREVSQVLNYLHERNRKGTEKGSRVTGGIVRFGLLAALALPLMLYAYISLQNLLPGPIGASRDLFWYLMTIISIGTWLYVYFNRSLREHSKGTDHGQSLMSLISEYRTFASTIVYRLGRGALGHGSCERFSVLICVDELDKIVDFEEIRTFVRRIKAIFEVPGVYYYISLAEDTLTSLYLGPAEGKNEIDSSFDHIIRIPPLASDTGETIANSYFAAHGQTVPGRMQRTIATVSFGIPRDIIRRCDEFIAQTEVKPSPDQVVFKIRQIQGIMGYELQQLSKEELGDLTGKSWESAANAKRIVDDRLQNDATLRLVLSLWVLSLIECVSTHTDENLWRTLSAELCEVGYRIPVDQISDLAHDIRTIHDRLLSA